MLFDDDVSCQQDVDAWDLVGMRPPAFLHNATYLGLPLQQGRDTPSALAGTCS